MLDGLGVRFLSLILARLRSPALDTYQSTAALLHENSR